MTVITKENNKTEGLHKTESISKMYKRNRETKTRNTLATVQLDKKWKVIEEYLDCKLSNNDIAEKYQLSTDTVENLVKDTYRKFQNVRETKILITTQGQPERFLRLKRDYILSDKINQEFLEKLSEPDSLVLTDNEMLFCELFADHGNEISALEESGLDAGLQKTNVKQDTFNSSLKLRSFYLRRKPNVAGMIKEIQQRKIKVMTSGKEHLQAELLAVVEKLRNNGDPRSVPAIPKSIELLGRSVGAYDDKQTIEVVGGDDALDKILNRAKSANNRELIEIH